MGSGSRNAVRRSTIFWGMCAAVLAVCLWTPPSHGQAKYGSQVINNIVYGRSHPNNSYAGTDLTMEGMLPTGDSGTNRPVLLFISDPKWGMWSQYFVPTKAYACFAFQAMSNESNRWVVRYLRAHAAEYGINPDQIAVYGYSKDALYALYMTVIDDDMFTGNEREMADPANHWGTPGQANACLLTAGNFFLPQEFFEEDDGAVLILKGCLDGTSGRYQAERFRNYCVLGNTPFAFFLAPESGHPIEWFHLVYHEKNRMEIWDEFLDNYMLHKPGKTMVSLHLKSQNGDRYVHPAVDPLYGPYGLYPKNQVVTLKADTDAPDRTFLYWTGDVESAQSAVNVTIDDQKEVTAVFALEDEPLVRLTANVEGAGEVTLSPPGGLYIQGTTVVLRAETPAFDHWGAGDFGDISGDAHVNATDIQLVVNAALGLAIGGRDADINDDGLTNALDIQTVINSALDIPVIAITMTGNKHITACFAGASEGEGEGEGEGEQGWEPGCENTGEHEYTIKGMGRTDAHWNDYMNAYEGIMLAPPSAIDIISNYGYNNLLVFDAWDAQIADGVCRNLTIGNEHAYPLDLIHPARFLQSAGHITIQAASDGTEGLLEIGSNGQINLGSAMGEATLAGGTLTVTGRYIRVGWRPGGTSAQAAMKAYGTLILQGGLLEHTNNEANALLYVGSYAQTGNNECWGTLVLDGAAWQTDLHTLFMANSASRLVIKPDAQGQVGTVVCRVALNIYAGTVEVDTTNYTPKPGDVWTIASAPNVTNHNGVISDPANYAIEYDLQSPTKAMRVRYIGGK